MIGKRQFLAGLGVMVTSPALAQIHTYHPGWPDKDGPGAGWIFRIDIA